MKYHVLEDYYELSDKLEVVLTPEQIEERVWEMGRAISADYAHVTKGEDAEKHSLLLIGLMKGVIMFMADLMRTITIPVEVDFMRTASRTSAAADIGLMELQYRPSLPTSVTNRHIIFVEDIIDKGLMLNHALRTLRLFNPASLEVCTMFEKPTFRLIDTPVKYKGFDLPHKFVVGYGLDYREKYRNLPFLAALRTERQ